MMTILFRKELSTEDEFEIAKKYIPNTIQFRSQIKPNSLVIPRYSYLPFHKELDAEIKLLNSKPINSLEQHDFMADVMTWATGPLYGLTPTTWDNWGNLPKDKSFIVKGQTNSRKTLFSTHMFCKTYKDVPTVASRLMDDMLLSQQRLVVREYVPLKKLEDGINGLPITNEHRTFWIAKNKKAHLLAKGFYWATHPELESSAILTEDGLKFAHGVANIIAKNDYASFFILDIAEKEDGDWILIEVNDGTMSGLGLVNPEELYKNLSIVLSGE